MKIPRRRWKGWGKAGAKFEKRVEGRDNGDREEDVFLRIFPHQSATLALFSTPWHGFSKMKRI